MAKRRKARLPGTRTATRIEQRKLLERVAQLKKKPERCSRNATTPLASAPTPAYASSWSRPCSLTNVDSWDACSAAG